MKAKEMQEDADKIKERFKKDVLDDPQAANDQFVKDSADLARKWGKEAAEALTDRKFNRMRPSMARVLGLETRSAKEG